MSEPQFTPGPLIVCKVYADNDALSHYELRRKETGELVVEVGDPDAMINKTYKVEKANVTLYAAAPDGYEYAETTAEVLRLLLETYKLPEQARKCLQDRIDESEKYRKKARGEE